MSQKTHEKRMKAIFKRRNRNPIDATHKEVYLDFEDEKGKKIRKKVVVKKE